MAGALDRPGTEPGTLHMINNASAAAPSALRPKYHSEG